MTSSTNGLTAISPLATPLPPLPEGEVLTPAQWVTLMSIGDTIIPSIRNTSHPSPMALQIDSTLYQAISTGIQTKLYSNSSPEVVVSYLEENASSIPGVQETIHRTLANYVRPDQRKGIAVILSALK